MITAPAAISPPATQPGSVVIRSTWRSPNTDANMLDAKNSTNDAVALPVSLRFMLNPVNLIRVFIISRHINRRLLAMFCNILAKPKNKIKTLFINKLKTQPQTSQL
jgi:hypothetical protein